MSNQIGRKECKGCVYLVVFDNGHTMFSEKCDMCRRKYPDLYEKEKK